MAMLIADHCKSSIKFEARKDQSSFNKLSAELYLLISSEFLNIHENTKAYNLFFSVEKESRKKLVHSITKHLSDTFAAFLILAKNSKAIDLKTFEKLKNCKELRIGLSRPILTMAYDSTFRATFTQYYVWRGVSKFLRFEIWKMYGIDIEINSEVLYTS